MMRLAFASLAVLVVGILLAPGAEAEQNVWQFTFDTGGLSNPIEIYASQTFPSNGVPQGGSFFASMQLISSEDTHDIVGDGVQAAGCTLLDEAVAPGTDETPWRNSRLQLRIDDATCSITRSMLVMNDAQTSMIYNHSFTFTVEAFRMVDLGQNPTYGGWSWWVPVLAAVALFWLSASRTMSSHVVWLLGVVLGTGAVIGLMLVPFGAATAPVVVPSILVLVVIIRLTVAWWGSREREEL